ncbi:MAG TPA: ROK family transcriptional regulator [Aggregatilineales bacterium]|nr:ROK family transcriptional regulator [Aggregatilineales bacterium]
MGNLSTISAPGMRGINRSAILDIIRRESPISRVAIAQKLGVSLPTVMRIVDDLIAEGLVRPQGTTEWSGGRRRALLEFNANGHVVIGVDLGGTRLYGAIADLGGKILQEVELSRHRLSGEEIYGCLEDVIERLLKSPELHDRRLYGIGVGAPGVTLHREGIVTWAPSLDWRDYPLKAKLTERFALPVMVDNDLNLATLGEYWFGAGQNTQTMALIVVGAGLGSGIIINGALYRGAHEASGEVGDVIPGREFLSRRYDGFGALESQVSGTGVVRRAREALKDQLSPAELVDLTAEVVFEARERGLPWATKIIDEALEYLAIMVANIAALLDPDLIVLGGGTITSSDLAAPVARLIAGTMPVQPNLVPSQLGYRATVLGAVVNVLHNSEDFYRVHKLS